MFIYNGNVSKNIKLNISIWTLKNHFPLKVADFVIKIVQLNIQLFFVCFPKICFCQHFKVVFVFKYFK